MNHVKTNMLNSSTASNNIIILVTTTILLFTMGASSSDNHMDDTSIINSQLESEINANGNTQNHDNDDKVDISKRDLPKVQLTLLNILKPVPIVDTIKEEEKYGNTGDKFNRIGRGIVGGVETLSNLLNSALNFPIDAVKKVSRSATEALNNLGGKLVGLQ